MIAMRATLVVVAALALAGELAAATLQSRDLLQKHDTLRLPAYPHQLVVKFRDEARARATDGVLTSEGGCDLSRVDRLRRRYGATFEPLLRVTDDTLARLEFKGAIRSEKAQPDLGGFHVVHVTEEHRQRVANALNALDCTEIVYFQELTPEPPCFDNGSPTSLYNNIQTYVNGTAGLNMGDVWALGNGGRGAGIRVADVEYGYNANHEDLCGVIMEPGQTINPGVINNGWDDHGTAILGQMVALDNSYGCRGLVPDVEMLFFTEWSVEQGFRRETAIANAIDELDAGDVLMLLMQMSGPGGGFGPAELDPAVWVLVRNATDAGIIVVAAAGNGDQDLDDPAYDEYNSRGDSGAIIVGAGTANTAHSKLSFSSYGNRVNLQGWGNSVFTLGYGTFSEIDGDVNQRYTNAFNGTSSATPMVAAACVALQGLAEEHLGRRLGPGEIRDVLMQTGINQGGVGGNIGRFPDILEAADWLGIGQMPGDANEDGLVDILDLLAVVLAWGECPQPCAADLDRNGFVDVNDLTAVILNWTAI